MTVFNEVHERKVSIKVSSLGARNIIYIVSTGSIRAGMQGMQKLLRLKNYFLQR
jgi:hypothetical protein